MKKMQLISIMSAIVMLTGCGNITSSSSNSDSKSENAQSNYSIPQITGYDLLWNDEFDGEELDDSIWSYDPHEPGWTNQELQEYTESTDNVFIRDGKLVLKAIKTEQNGKPYYTSGKIKSQNKKDFLYGKVVARAKVPEGKGLWPAIWMMPKDESLYGQWPKCGEIDIMEVLGSSVDTAYSTLHYGEPHGEQQGTRVLQNGSYADSFHDYSVEWEPGEIRFYIDDELTLTANDWFSGDANGNEKEYPAPFNQPFFVQMNLAVGGTWPGDPDETTNFDNAEFEIDYVRVYQKPEYDTNVTKPEAKLREPLADGNYVYNGDFAKDEDLDSDEDWKFMLFEGGEGNAEIKDNMIVITTQNQGTVDYSVQLVQPEMPIMKGKKYKVTFDAWADEERDIIVCVSAPNAGWIRYLQDTTVGITTERKSYEYEFEMTNKDDPTGRLEFNLGNRGSTATVYLTNVRLEEIK
ncbi:MAG: family 16 glycosylhydrolase [Ruminococcus sp.]|nr:family 16 glycosylhydrolase [Ruminococcus sp.]